MNEIDLLRCYIGDAKGAVPIVEQKGVVNTMRLNRTVRELAETTTGGVVLLRQGHGRLLRSAERLQADLRLQFARRLPGVIGEVVEKEIEEGLITLVEVHSRHPAPPLAPPRRARRGSKKATRRREHDDRPELAMVEGTSVEDLHQGLVRELLTTGVVPYAPKPPHNQEDFEHALAASGIAYVQPGGVVPTVAGLVAVGRRPDLVLPGMAVRVIVESKGEHRFVGNVLELVDRVPELPVLNEGVGRGVLIELLVNALAHRDWSVKVRTQPFVLKRSADKLELSHPGTLVRREPPNPTLLRLLVCLGLAEGKGEGLLRLRRLISEEGNCGPFLQAEGGVVTATVTLPTDVPGWLLGEDPEPEHEPKDIRNEAQAQAKRDEAQAPEVNAEQPTPPPAVVAPVEPTPVPPPALAAEPEPPWFPATAKQQQLIDALQILERATTKELVEALGWPRSSIRDVLASLVKAGQVERLAPFPRSPMQVYQLARKRSRAAVAEGQVEGGKR